MIRIAGLWELGWNTPIKEADLWQYVLAEFGVERWFMAPISGIAGPSLLSEVADLQQMIDDHREEGVPIVFVDEKGATPMREFKHPADVLYVFGKSSLSPLVGYGRGDASVKIETIRNSGGMWAHQAASVLLYDRMLKS